MLTEVKFIKVFQNGKDLSVVGIRHCHWKTVPQQFPVSDILKTETLWSYGVKPGILKGGSQSEVSKHRGDFDSLEYSRSKVALVNEWKKSPANRTHRPQDRSEKR